VIAKFLADPDPLIVMNAARALGDTGSGDAVGELISSIPSAKEDYELAGIVNGLKTLTHRTTSQDPRKQHDPNDRMAIYQRWNGWWAVHHRDAEIYGPDSCGAITQLD
jgi:HEAT repeat protein